MTSILNAVRTKSQEKLQELQNELEHTYCDFSMDRSVCIYACGSLGRLEATDSSDLDLFFITQDDGPLNPGLASTTTSRKKGNCISRLDTYLFFSRLHDVTKRLGYPLPSKGGAYWTFISKSELLDIGSREEDYVNSFTARLLLLLESKPLYNKCYYEALIKETVNKYFVDYEENQDGFYPLFLMNDILRYWYTLTLNYEYRRDSSDSKNERYWKRLKLKFARLITCFSMIACLYEKNITPERVEEYIKMTPFERIRILGEIVPHVAELAEEIERGYEWYLDLRANQESNWWDSPNHKDEAFRQADVFHDIVVSKLMGAVSSYNPKLAAKADMHCILI